MQIRKFALAIAALFIIFCIQPLDASAAPSLKVKTTLGFDGKAKYGEGLPITITVENSGDAFSGDIVLDMFESYSLGNGQAIPFEIGANETKSVQIATSGLSDDYLYSNSNTKLVHFYEGGWEKGKSIDYKGSKNLKVNFMDPSTTFYLTLTNSADRLTVLNGLKQSNSQVIHLSQLSDFTFPTEGIAWQMADYIFIDEYVLADLSNSQQQALVDYVSSGGYILTGSSDNTSAEVGLLAEHLPFHLQSTIKNLSPQTVSSITGEKLLTNDLTVYEATLIEGAQPLINLDGTLLAGQKKLGKGAIIQTTFSLGDTPLAKDEAYPELLKKILNPLKTQSNNYMYGNNVKDQLVHDIGNTNSLFASFKVSTPLMIGIVIVYMLLVGPLLYIILKRKDKREYAWGIIPLLAIITSAAIFGYGAKDRIAKPQVQQSSFLYVNEDSSLSGYYAESILSNKGGEFAFTSPTSTSMVANRAYNSFTGEVVNIHENVILEKSASSSELTFRDLGYWSVSSFYGETYIPKVGKIDSNLRVEASKLSGTITNSFPFKLKDVSIWSGSKLIELGDLEPGEQMEVNKEIGSIMLSPTSNPYINSSGSWGQNAANQDDLITQRKKSLYSTSKTMEQQTAKPAITAFVEDNVLPIELKDKKVEMSALHLLIQPFEAETIISGDFTLPSTSFTVNLEANAIGKYMEPMENSTFEWYLDDGEYTTSWKLPETIVVEDVNYTQLQIANTDRNSQTIELWNNKSETYESVDESRFTIKENISDYINQDGVIIYKLTKDSIDGNSYTRLPEVRLKGEVK